MLDSRGNNTWRGHRAGSSHFQVLQHLSGKKYGHLPYNYVSLYSD